MDVRGRQRLIQKLEHKEISLQCDLDTFRTRFKREASGNDHFDPGHALRSELDSITFWLEDFARFALETARSISPQRWTFELAVERIGRTLQRFVPHAHVCALQLRRTDTREKTKILNDEAIGRVERAFAVVEELIAEAEHDFQPKHTTEARQPSVDDLDDWIRACGTSNSKTGWDLIGRQADLRKPTHAFFMERWRVLSRGRRRGRPPKHSSTKAER